MNQFSKPSFSSTFFSRLKQLFDCIIIQDVQLIDSDNYKIPYLLDHDYDFHDFHDFDQTDESSDVPLLEVKRIGNHRKIVTNHKTVNNHKNIVTNRHQIVDNHPKMHNNHQKIDISHQKIHDNRRQIHDNHQKIVYNVRNIDNNHQNTVTNHIEIDNNHQNTVINHEKIDNNHQLTKTDRMKKQMTNLKSNVFKIDCESNKLFSNLSTQFINWPIKNKEKYVHELVKISLQYIKLEDYDRAEAALFEILDFYLDKFVNISKAIETLRLLDQIYFKMNRYLEQIEVNKLILNIARSDAQIKRSSIDKIVNAYRKMNLEHKAQIYEQKFNDNKKIIKK